MNETLKIRKVLSTPKKKIFIKVQYDTVEKEQ